MEYGRYRYDEILDIVSYNFIKLKNIKVPDVYNELLIHHYPTEKYLKKNDRKLIDSILDMYGLKSKILNKKTHENNLICFSSLLLLKCLLGEDYIKYISNLNDIIFKVKDKSTKSINFYEKLTYDGYINLITTKKEKENIIKIINNYFSVKERGHHFRDVYFDLADHYRMVKDLKTYNIDHKPISSITFENFLEEHREISKLYKKIKKGYIIEICYEENTIKNIEKPISYNDIIYKPIILKNSDDYDEESYHMHHCVNSYTNKNSSIIVSLRKEATTDRVTCEYNIGNGDCLQSRYISNQEPPKDFIEPLP